MTPTTILELELEQELVNLKMRVERLEVTVHRLVRDGQRVEPPKPGVPLDQEQLLTWLKAEGLVVEPPPMVRIHAERWRSRTEEEKQAIRQELDHLPPGPMASDIIIENRR
ncbi:MAG: hypothetical protein ACE5HA_14335 [Anaerolineae bacterium]